MLYLISYLHLKLFVCLKISLRFTPIPQKKVWAAAVGWGYVSNCEGEKREKIEERERRVGLMCHVDDMSTLNGQFNTV